MQLQVGDLAKKNILFIVYSEVSITSKAYQ